ncbi:hypothetical protein AVEN_78735-1, partial [Araneus ventricosus]
AKRLPHTLPSPEQQSGAGKRRSLHGCVESS